MRKLLIGGIAVAVILFAAVAGYQLGAGSWPSAATWIARVVSTKDAIQQKQTDARQVLYWRDPDGKPAYAAAPAKTADGRDFVPVHDDEEPDFPENKKRSPSEAMAVGTGERKIIYYRNPMGLPDTSPIPKKDWMGMDYIAVYDGEEEEGSTVKVSLDKVQRSGVRTAPVEMRRMVRPLRAPGVAKPDERTLRSISLRADGFIEKLHVNETGQYVKAGEPLFRVYSPEMLRSLIDLRLSASVGGDRRAGLLSAEQKLRNFEIADAVAAEVKRSGEVPMAFDWPAPISGVVMKKPVVEGQMARMGEELFRIADLSSIWVIADVAEQDIGLIKIGAPAKVSFRAFPGEVFEGRVTFVLHELEMATRTAKVRIEVKNADHRIKHEMFAEVEINAGANEAERLVVPVSALIDSGNRQVVIVERGEGRFEPRPVKAGMRNDGFVEIMEGVKAGESVVVAANFLIDAESNLKAALSGFMSAPPSEGSPNDKGLDTMGAKP